MTYSAGVVQPNQKTITLDKLYLVSGTKLGGSNEVDVRWQQKRNIWVDSGTINIYSSNSSTKPTALSDMTLNFDDTNVSGLNEINIIPRWLAFVQVSGTSTEVIATGIDVEEQGDIS